MSTIVPIDDNTLEASTSPLPNVPKGTRLEIWWPEDSRFYMGHVVGLRDPKCSNNKTTNKKRKRELWKIRYDDNEVEWVDLRTERYRILSSSDDDKVDPDGKLPKNDTSAVRIGSTVNVWWEYYNQYFPGIVKRIRTNRTKAWFVQYHDGDARWEDLTRTKFDLLQDDGNEEEEEEEEHDDDFVHIGVPQEV